MNKVIRILSLALALLLTVGLLGTASVGVSAEESPFQGTSVTLGGALTVNFYVEVTDTQNAVMTFQVGGDTQTVPVTQAQHIEGSIYNFSCGIAAAQMTDVIEATLTDSGKTYEKSTSVREYAMKLLASKRWDSLAAVDMILATLHYGATAQSFFGYNLDAIANEGYQMPDAPEIPSVDTSNMVSGSVSGASFYGASLVFESNVAVRFYFVGDVTGVTFQCGDTVLTPVEKDGMYYVEAGNINPQDYNEEITLTVNDTMTVTYSPMYYISRMYSKTDKAQLKTLLATMYQYHLTAQTYIQDPLGNDKDNLVSAQ